MHDYRYKERRSYNFWWNLLEVGFNLSVVVCGAGRSRPTIVTS